MKGYTTKEILKPDFWLPGDRKELEMVYRTLAKSADQRLVRLKYYEHDEGFKPATKWAYARAMRDIKSWSGSQAKRFNTAPPESDTDLLSKIQDIKHFLESPTSTKKGIIEVYKKRADTLNKNMRIDNPDWKDLTWKDLAQYYDSKLNTKLDEKYGSKTAVTVYSNIKANEKEIVDDIKKKKDIHIKVEDEVLQTTIENVLKDYSKEVQAALK